jgi:methylmalonyl-CoA mutase
MPRNSIHLSLIETFAKANSDLWKRAASQEIDGKDPFQTLSWKADDDIIFFPYYDSENLDGLSYLKKFSLTVADDSFSGPRKWLNVPSVQITDENKANTEALQHLKEGADGIFFDVSSDSDVATHTLLHEIEWAYCSLFFRGERNTCTSIARYITEKKTDPDSIAGALFWETNPKKSDVSFFLNHTTNFRALGLLIDRSTASAEIATALTRAVQQVEALNASPGDLNAVFKAIAFSLPAEVGFLQTIAKLKALRLLWYQVARAYNVTGYHFADLHIHVRVEVWTNSNYQPHGNMLNNTAGAIASILGGCDSLTVYPENNLHGTMARVSRNVSSVLREESYLDKVSDPLAGSYAVESMVNTLAEKAWSIFQTRIQ